MTRDEIFEALQKRGVSWVEVEFSGGGDSGGVDGVRYYDDEDQEMKEIDLVTKKELNLYNLRYQWDRETGDELADPEKDETYQNLITNCLKDYSIFDEANEPSLLRYFALADYIDDKYSDMPGMIKASAEIRDLAEITIIRNTLEQPVYGEYYTFAGDFNVQGELIWDVVYKTVQMTGSEFSPNSFVKTF